jgi:hypothetical protein
MSRTSNYESAFICAARGWHSRPVILAAKSPAAPRGFPDRFHNAATGGKL